MEEGLRWKPEVCAETCAIAEKIVTKAMIDGNAAILFTKRGREEEEFETFSKSQRFRRLRI